MRRWTEYAVAAAQLSTAAADGTSLCEPLRRVLPIDGASVATLVRPFEPEIVCSSDDDAARHGQLQLDLGEGPAWTALRQGRPELVPDLRDRSADWPLLAEALGDDALRAIYAFPLNVGALDIGAVDLYSDSPGTMDATDVDDAVELVAIVARQVLRRAMQRLDTSVEDSLDASWFSRREVHQATGMLIAQFRVTPDDALLILRAHAFVLDRPVLDVAADIVARRITIAADPGPDPTPFVG